MAPPDANAGSRTAPSPDRFSFNNQKSIIPPAAPANPAAAPGHPRRKIVKPSQQPGASNIATMDEAFIILQRAEQRRHEAVLDAARTEYLLRRTTERIAESKALLENTLPPSSLSIARGTTKDQHRQPAVLPRSHGR